MKFLSSVFSLLARGGNKPLISGKALATTGAVAGAGVAGAGVDIAKNGGDGYIGNFVQWINQVPGEGAVRAGVAVAAEKIWATWEHIGRAISGISLAFLDEDWGLGIQNFGRRMQGVEVLTEAQSREALGYAKPVIVAGAAPTNGSGNGPGIDPTTTEGINATQGQATATFSDVWNSDAEFDGMRTAAVGIDGIYKGAIDGISSLGYAVDAMNWAVSKTGLPVSDKPFMGKEFMQEGLTSAYNAYIGGYAPSVHNIQPRNLTEYVVGGAGHLTGEFAAAGAIAKTIQVGGLATEATVSTNKYIVGSAVGDTLKPVAP